MLSDEIQAAVVTLVERGNYARHAAQAVGISERTFHNWMERGAAEERRVADGQEASESEAPYVRFMQAVKEARGKAISDLLARIYDAAAGSDERAGQWQAAAWLLERTDTESFGRRERVHLTGKDDGPVEVVISDPLRQSEIDALCEELDERRRSRAADVGPVGAPVGAEDGTAEPAPT